MKFFLVGPGKVGISLSVLLERAGHSCLGCWSRSKKGCRRVSGYLPDVSCSDNLPGSVRDADFILLAPAESALAGMVDMMMRSGQLREGQTLFHVSGVYTSDILKRSRDPVIHAGSIHPVQSVATVEAGLELLPRSFFSLEGDDTAVEMGTRLVEDIGGTPVRITSTQRPLYHCALSTASNFLVLLAWTSWKMLLAAGIEKKIAGELLSGLMKGTLANLEVLGPQAALTGPVLRGDWRTVEKHMESLKQAFPEGEDLYRTGSALLLEIARARGEAPSEGLERITQLIKNGVIDMRSEKEQELEIVYQPKDELEGRILEGMLKGEEIPCYLRSRQIPWMDDIMELVEGFWGDLLVPRADAERAKKAIEEYQKREETS